MSTQSVFFVNLKFSVRNLFKFIFLSWASILHEISSRTFWIFGILSQMSAWSFLRGSKDLLLPRMFDDPSQDELAEDDATDEDLFAIG